MEAQVLSGILPVSQTSAALGCIAWIMQRLPLEKVFQLEHPAVEDEPVVEVEDKRTWRGSAPVRPKKVIEPPKWTALYLLVAYARKRGWLTAMAGREDVMRAGNASKFHCSTCLVCGLTWFFPPSFKKPG
jgi:hypothetical protein